MPERQPGTAGLLGAGLLHDTVAEELAVQGWRISLAQAADPTWFRPQPTVLVAASDGWNTADHTTAARAAARYGATWLPVRTELSHAVVGPLAVPGWPACAQCAETRRRRIRADQARYDAVWQLHGAQLAARPSSWLTGLGAHLVATLVADELARQAGDGPPRTRLGLLRVHLADLTITRHAFLPDPRCPDCGQLPADAPELATITLRSRPAQPPGSYRTRAIADELDSLVSTYVDEQTGLVRSLDGWDHGDHGGLVATTAPVGIRAGAAGAGHGLAASVRASRLTALLEALERYGGAVPGGRRTAVTATWAEVAGHAVDPRTLGGYAPAQYRLPDFPVRPFAETRPYRWVWGWSFARGDPVLVPESCAYYGAGCAGEPGEPGEPGELREPAAAGEPVVIETSNGCALGSCVEEAILYGLLEVAERDAFLLTWYAQLPAPRIDLDTAGDRAVPLLAATILARTGCRVIAFDITAEQRIPAVWAMAVNPGDPDRPARYCAAGAHPDPDRAVLGALAELDHGLSRLILDYADPHLCERAALLAADPDQVVRMDDHMLCYADHTAAPRLDFLTDSPALCEIGKIGDAGRGGFTSDDVRDNLVEAVQRYTANGMDVIVVDQTAPEHLAGGLRCVKVLIPGTLPMTFGHRYRRLNGLPRLYQVPQQLGYRRRPLRPTEVNPYPHPFP